MFNRILNRSKDYLTCFPGVEKSRIEKMKGRVSCLLYHRIENYLEQPFLNAGRSPVTSPEDFNRELSYLKQLPTEFYTLADLNKGRFPDPETIGIVICFDDCFRCNYVQGLNVLTDNQIPAVFFQCTAFINSSSLIWEHLLYWLHDNEQLRPEYQNLVRDTLKITAIDHNNLPDLIRQRCSPAIIKQHILELINQHGLNNEVEKIAQHIYPDKQHISRAFEQGHEIASHGHNHYFRDQIDHATFELELTKSSSAINAITGQQPVSFSYPFNSFETGDHERVAQHYRNIGCVNNQRITQPLAEHSNLIPRITWPGKSSNVSRMKRWLLTGGF